MVTVMGLSVADFTETSEERVLLLPPRPLTFEEFVRLFGEDDDVELVDGLVVRQMTAGYAHEDLTGWLLSIMRLYASAKDLGIVLGSRTAVRISPYQARLPDLLFVRRERSEIVQEQGVMGAPDLVIEIVSPTDRPSDILAREADYRSIGIEEIWFVDQRRKQVRVLRRKDGDYEERVVRRGVVRSRVVEGFWLRAEWLFQRPLPSAWQTLQQLLR